MCSVGVSKFVSVTSGGVRDWPPRAVRSRFVTVITVGDWPQAVSTRVRGGRIQVTGCRVGRGRFLDSHPIFIKNVSFSIPSHS